MVTYQHEILSTKGGFHRHKLEVVNILLSWMFTGPAWIKKRCLCFYVLPGIANNTLLSSLLPVLFPREQHICISDRETSFAYEH